MHVEKALINHYTIHIQSTSVNMSPFEQPPTPTPQTHPIEEAMLRASPSTAQGANHDDDYDSDSNVYASASGAPGGSAEGAHDNTPLQLSTNPQEQRIFLPEDCTRAQASAALNKRAPLNEMGFPAYFVRSDLLPSNLRTLTQGDVEAACETLVYWEGYPTMTNGVAFWHRLPHEPYDGYLLFTQYIDQVETVGIRQLDLLAASTGEEQDKITNLYHEYLWASRARAHDIFCSAAEQKRRILLTRKTENKHLNVAGALFDKLLERFHGENADWMDELNAKEAIEVLETLVKIQRLSLGLTGANASSLPKNPIPDGADTESIIRHITRGAGIGVARETDFIEKLRALTEDSEAGMALQEVILKVGRSGQSNADVFNDDF